MLFFNFYKSQKAFVRILDCLDASDHCFFTFLSLFFDWLWISNIKENPINTIPVNKPEGELGTSSNEKRPNKHGKTKSAAEDRGCAVTECSLPYTIASMCSWTSKRTVSIGINIRSKLFSTTARSLTHNCIHVELIPRSIGPSML